MSGKKLTVFLLSALFTATTFAQNFEGKIVYQNIYKSKIPQVTDEQFASMMGSTYEYYIKGGDYKMIINGTYLLGQTYLNNHNKLYNKVASTDTLLWNDGSVNADTVLSTKINKGVVDILGYKCDELILVCISGTYKFYYNSKFGADLAAYAKHQYGNWYNYLKLAKALPLKYVIDTQQFYSESTASDIKPMALSQADFQLPKGAVTAKSPY